MAAASVSAVLVIASIWITARVVHVAMDPWDIESLHRFHEYCGQVRTSVSADAVDLESEDAHRRVDAADQFYNSRTHHSWFEVQLCAATRPPDLLVRDRCWNANDFACLAQLARRAAESIPVYLPAE